MKKTSCLKLFFISCRCRWHRWLTFTFEYLSEFSLKILNGPNRILRGLKTNHVKNLKPKISCQPPFKRGLYSTPYSPLQKVLRVPVKYSVLGVWRWTIWVNHKYSFCLSIGEVYTLAAHKPIHVVAPEYCIDKRRMPSIDLYSQVWFKNLESNKISLAQFYNLQVLHVFYYTMIILFEPNYAEHRSLFSGMVQEPRKQ